MYQKDKKVKTSRVYQKDKLVRTRPAGLLNAQEAADFTGLTVGTLYALKSHGKIPFVKRPGGKYLYFEEEKLKNWMLGKN